MFSKSSEDLSIPPQDVIYRLLVSYKCDSSQVDEFRKQSALYGALSNPMMQQFFVESDAGEENTDSGLYEAELEKAKVFLSQQKLTATEKDSAVKSFEMIAAEINEKKNNSQPKSR